MVDDIGEYVRACQQLGYQHPDLTQHSAQMAQWYGSEDGLALHSLDADATALSLVAAAADDAVQRQADVMAVLSGAWTGSGAGAALDFLMRNHRAAASVAAAVRQAVDALTTLRDDLWRAVDGKVAATQALGSGYEGQRAEWLAAANTVTTGAGDRAAASELIELRVKPFVDNDVRVTWVAAMKDGNVAVTAAYDTALTRLREVPNAVFEVPGELGPRVGEPDAPGPSAATVPSAVAGSPPTFVSAPPVASPAFATPAAAAPAAPPPVAPPFVDPLAATPATPTAPPMSPLGDLGGGMPSLGSGASGFGQQLADLIGGLVGSSRDGLSEVPELDPADEFDGEEETEPADAAVESDREKDEEPTTPDDTESTVKPETEPEAEPEPEPAATPVPPPPEPIPPSPPVVPEALPAEQTPCELAADELPQVGE